MTRDDRLGVPVGDHSPDLAWSSNVQGFSQSNVARETRNSLRRDITIVFEGQGKGCQGALAHAIARQADKRPENPEAGQIPSESRTRITQKHVIKSNTSVGRIPGALPTRRVSS